MVTAALVDAKGPTGNLYLRNRSRGDAGQGDG
jgi:hypothetical protein